MKVTINDKEVEYQSDYPNGWKFSAGDPFKFPVLIGDQQCFIKRFEQKGPRDISGWDLLVKMTGKHDNNLSVIYDIKNVQEKEKEIYYVFYEFLDGVTLDKNVRNTNINLTQLSNDLFNAIRSIQKYEFWFADFCEKNIFCQKDGTFLLVDVDSAQRISDMPDNEMYGSKDYWILVFKFYKEILNKSNIQLSDINGISFNYLQIAFLVLRLKLFFIGKKKDYNSTELYNQLPYRLNEAGAEFKDFYFKVYSKGNQALNETEIVQLAEIIEKRIITNDNIKETFMEPANLPVIKEFIVNNYEVSRGGEFTLSWQVENANKLELYKNGAMFRTLDVNQRSVNLIGFADGTRQESSYQLYAYKNLSLAKSDPIIIKLKETESHRETETTKETKPGKRKLIKIIGILLGLIVIAALFIFIGNNKGKIEPYLKQKFLRQGIDSTITIYGRNFPEENQILVLINDNRASLISSTKDSLLVLLPKSKFTASSDSAYVFISYNNQIKNAGSFSFLQPVQIKQREIYEDSTIRFFGKNLNPNSIKVFLGNREIQALTKTDDGIDVKVPAWEDKAQGQTINLSMREGNNIIFSKNFKVSNDIVNLSKLTSQARWIGGVIISDGNSTTNTITLAWPGDPNDPNGSARSDIVTMEDNKNYTALRMHPMWLSNGTVKGFFPWSTLKGKKVFKAKLGFLKDGLSTDGVVFQVWVHYRINQAETWEPLSRMNKFYNQNLANMQVDLPNHIPNDFYIELRVDAGNQSNSDWAAWVNPEVITKKLRIMTFKDFRFKFEVGTGSRILR